MILSVSHLSQCIYLGALLISYRCYSCTLALTAKFLYTKKKLDVHGGPSSSLVSSPHQRTPLHWAAVEGHTDSVELLIQAGADVNIKDDDGVSE